MAIILFVLLTAIGFAQGTTDALPLLREVAEASGNLTSYRAEGHIAEELDLGGQMKDEFAFRVFTRGPNQMRIEVSGGPDYATGYPYLAVCKGQTGWVYYEKIKGFEEIGAREARPGYCAPSSLTSFEHVADEVRSAVITGSDRVQFEGRAHSCLVVKAHYRVINDLMVSPGIVRKVGRVDRTMCIDRERKLILRDSVDADLSAEPDHPHVLSTITYDRIERNPDLDPALFEFQPPLGATAVEIPEIKPPQATVEIPRAMHVHWPAEPVSKTEPEYTQEAWDEGIQGEVILVPDIDADGAIGDIKIQQSLGYGLDEKAIECVRQWRFNPSTEDGKPVKGGAWVTVNFSLPDKRPTQPTLAQITRPVAPPRLPVVELKIPTDLDFFFYVIAVNFKTPEICPKIRPLVMGSGGGFSPHGLQVQDLQSECYGELATDLHDAQLCDYVKPVRTQELDGSKFDKEYCLTQLHGIPSIASPDPHRMDQFVEFVRQLGYDDRQIAAFRYGDSFHNPTYVAYKALLADPKFVDRVRHAPGYEEARASNKVRPANAVEYLDQMVAVDTRAPGLCGKISPNATFTRAHGQPRLLQSNCYAGFAYDDLDAGLCDQLPQAGASPYANDTYHSREGCQKNVAIYISRDFKKGGLPAGSVPFPDPAYFEDALQQIGFSAAETANLVAKPSPDDYWDFVFGLSLWGSARDRAEFVGRVMSLR